MNGKWINNLVRCDAFRANNLAIDGSPIVTQCYRVSDPSTYLADRNEHSSYENIRRGDIVYRRSSFDENPYFEPLFVGPSAALFYRETSPQLVERIASIDAFGPPPPIGTIRQLDDESDARYSVFSDVFDQINRNTYRRS